MKILQINEIKAIIATYKLQLHSGISRTVESLQSLCYSIFSPKAFMVFLMYSFPLIKNILIHIQYFHVNESFTDTFLKPANKLLKFC